MSPCGEPPHRPYKEHRTCHAEAAEDQPADFVEKAFFGRLTLNEFVDLALVESHVISPRMLLTSLTDSA